MDFGAIPGNTSDPFVNSNAFNQAVLAANIDGGEVLVPEGYTFLMMPVELINVANITVTI